MPRPSVSVSDGEDLHSRLPFPVDNCVWKAPQNEFVGCLFASRPPTGRLDHAAYRTIYFGNKFRGRGFTSLQIPLNSGPQFGKRRRIDFEQLTGHSGLPRSSAAPPPRERVSPCPNPNPGCGGRISFSHSSPPPPPRVSSRLSRREPASAARAPAGSASAFFRSSESSSAIVAFYPRRPSLPTYPRCRVMRTETPSSEAP